MKFLAAFIICMCALTGVTGCGSGTSAQERSNSIYYWRTTFTLSDEERNFIERHDIGKIYMRFFDVGCATVSKPGQEVVPEATIRFIDSVPQGIEVVPTIYITNYAMYDMRMHEREYAEKIVKRVNAICNRNGIKYRELQLDCDWNKGTRSHFFKLCEAVKQCLDSTQSVSSTIRLHQLTQSPPPVDRGVLMVYNTGNLMEMTTENSIFSKKDIEPYLADGRLADYALPLDVAYPAYGWSVVFYPNEGKYRFDRLMRRTDFTQYPEMKCVAQNMYEATSSVVFSAAGEVHDYVTEGHKVKVERPDADEIIDIKAMIDRLLGGKPHANIIYHLDEEQLKHYTDNEISDIYTRR